jgi:hypothetical protein
VTAAGLALRPWDRINFAPAVPLPYEELKALGRWADEGAIEVASNRSTGLAQVAIVAER